jgi:hypothetical protein
MLCQRQCQQRNTREAAEDQAAEIMRITLLRHLHLLGIQVAAGDSTSIVDGVVSQTTIAGTGGIIMSVEDRRAFIKNVLVSRVS